jgi:signal transduction histidine kinase
MFIGGLAASGAIIILLGIVGGIAIRRSLLAKVKDIDQAATAIVRGDFTHRLPHHGGESELASLAKTANLMLDQIEQLMKGVINASNSIAHDLRTPLAELRSRLEDLARQEKNSRKLKGRSKTSTVSLLFLMLCYGWSKSTQALEERASPPWMRLQLLRTSASSIVHWQNRLEKLLTIGRQVHCE